MKKLVLAASAAALASSAQAATYDAFSSFNGTQGAGGFSYLKLPNAMGQAPSPLATSGSCVVPVSQCLQDGGNLPGVYKSNAAFKYGSYNVPDDRLLVHPGPDSSIGIFFNAPQAGTYDYAVSLNVLDDQPSGVAIIRVTNQTGSPVSDVLGGIGGGLPAVSRTGSVTLQSGQFLAFIVHNAGSYANDSIGFNFTLMTAAVPEPRSWAMIIFGFALAGAAVRRGIMKKTIHA
jgi:opacity protein-like surface antigen